MRNLQLLGLIVSLCLGFTAEAWSAPAKKPAAAARKKASKKAPAPAPTPFERASKRTEELFSAFRGVRQGELTDAEKAEQDALWKKLDGFFLWDQIASDALGEHRAALSEEQQQRYADLFQKLLRRSTYSRMGDWLGDAATELLPGAEGAEGGGLPLWVQVKVQWASGREPVTIGFLWCAAEKAERICGVTVNGDSVVKDYEAQIGRMLADLGPQGFLEKLQARLDADAL